MADGRYKFSVWNPPVNDDEEPNWIEWESAEAVAPPCIFAELLEGISERGLRAEFALEAALALLPFLSLQDAALVQRSMATLIRSDERLRNGIATLPLKAQAALRPLMR